MPTDRPRLGNPPSKVFVTLWYGHSDAYKLWADVYILEAMCILRVYIREALRMGKKPSLTFVIDSKGGVIFAKVPAAAAASFEEDCMMCMRRNIHICCVLYSIHAAIFGCFQPSNNPAMKIHWMVLRIFLIKQVSVSNSKVSNSFPRLQIRLTSWGLNIIGTLRLGWLLCWLR